MTQNRIVEIVCDGNEIVGHGHVTRSKALAKYLADIGMTIRLKCVSQAAHLGLPVYDASSEPADIYVFDSHYGLDSLISSARLQGSITVTLDWFGRVEPDYNIVIYPHHDIKALKAKFSGFKYVILREEITSILPIRTGKVQNVMICLGGGDVLGQGHQVAEILDSKGYYVTLIQGSFAKNQSLTDSFNVLINPPNFVDLLAGTDWVVTNGGGCLFESLYLGKPAYVLPQTPFEKRIAQAVFENDAILGVGLPDIKNLKLDDFDMVARKGRDLVDGRGIERIAKIITNL